MELPDIQDIQKNRPYLYKGTIFKKLAKNLKEILRFLIASANFLNVKLQDQVDINKEIITLTQNEDIEEVIKLFKDFLSARIRNISFDKNIWIDYLSVFKDVDIQKIISTIKSLETIYRKNDFPELYKNANDILHSTEIKLISEKKLDSKTIFQLFTIDADYAESNREVKDVRILEGINYDELDADFLKQLKDKKIKLEKIFYRNYNH